MLIIKYTKLKDCIWTLHNFVNDINFQSTNTLLRPDLVVILIILQKTCFLFPFYFSPITFQQGFWSVITHSYLGGFNIQFLVHHSVAADGCNRQQKLDKGFCKREIFLEDITYVGLIVQSNSTFV